MDFKFKAVIGVKGWVGGFVVLSNEGRGTIDTIVCDERRSKELRRSPTRLRGN